MDEAIDLQPTTPPRQQLSRDERIRIRVLRDIGWTHQAIVEHTGATIRQVRYAIATQATPQRRSGRPPILTPSQINSLVEFVYISKANRRMAICQIPKALGWDCSEYAVQYALRRAGFAQYLAQRKPPISEANRQIRLRWATQHLHWTPEQWSEILWSDETWVTAGNHRRTWVTRRKGEELDPTCIVEREQRKKGWMFWGCFSGKYGKGPGIFWEKEWGTITTESYCQHTVPIIEGWIRLCNGQQMFIQDSAPAHKAKETLEELQERGIRVIFWPAYSPDLNPIETIWCIMKDYIARHFPEKLSYDQLRSAVKEAWDSIEDSKFQELLNSMPARCQAVIDANGMHIPY
jgi:hypothetical protein